jgi:hypothetical protein
MRPRMPGRHSRKANRIQSTFSCQPSDPRRIDQLKRWQTNYFQDTPFVLHRHLHLPAENSRSQSAEEAINCECLNQRIERPNPVGPHRPLTICRHRTSRLLEKVGHRNILENWALPISRILECIADLQISGLQRSGSLPIQTFDITSPLQNEVSVRSSCSSLCLRTYIWWHI